MTVDNLLFLNWFPFGVKKISTHAHKIGPWYLSVEHSRPFKWSSPDSLHDWPIFCIEEALQGLKKFIHRITWKTYWKGYVKVVSLFSRWQQTSWAWRLQLVSGKFLEACYNLVPRAFPLKVGGAGTRLGMLVSPYWALESVVCFPPILRNLEFFHFDFKAREWAEKINLVEFFYEFFLFKWRICV